MTSNMGSDIILENFEDLQAVGDDHRQDIINTTKVEVFELLKDNLRPEFLNRIDDKIMFLPLTRDEIKKIGKLMLKKVHKNLAKQELYMQVSENAMDLLADLGYDPQFGARPMKRVIEREVVNQLAKEVLSGRFVTGETIYVDAINGNFIFREVPTGVKIEEPEKKEAAKKAEAEEKRNAERKKNVDDLMKATKDLKDEIKRSGGPEPQPE